MGDINSMNLPCLTFVLPIDSTYSGKKAVISSSSSFSSFVLSFFFLDLYLNVSLFVIINVVSRNS